MSSIDEIAYHNKLLSTDPQEKFFLAFITMVIGLLSEAIIVQAVILLIMGYLVVVQGGVGYKVYLKRMLLPVSFLLLGLLPIVFKIEIKSLTQFTLGLTDRGLESAVILTLRALGSVSCLYFLILTTPLHEIVYVLEKIRVPGLLREMMVLMYRFIFIFIATANQIYVAQKLRGGYNKLKSSFYSLAQLVILLLFKVNYRGQMTYLALMSRGYDGELKVVKPSYRYSKINWFKIAVFEACLILLVWFTR